MSGEQLNNNQLLDIATVSLYAEWSEEHYAAGWMSIDAAHADEFEKWLRGKVKDGFEDYQADALPILREVVKRVFEEQQ